MPLKILFVLCILCFITGGKKVEVPNLSTVFREDVFSNSNITAFQDIANMQNQDPRELKRKQNREYYAKNKDEIAKRRRQARELKKQSTTPVIDENMIRELLLVPALLGLTCSLSLCVVWEIQGIYNRIFEQTENAEVIAEVALTRESRGGQRNSCQGQMIERQWRYEVYVTLN